MKKVFLLSLLALPLSLSAQFWLTREQEYFYIGTGVDLRNAVFGGTVNPAAYDGTFLLGYRNEGFGIVATYESFSAIRYESFGISPGWVMRPGRMFIPVTTLSLSVIKRPWKVYPSLAANGIIEYHFDRFFIYLRGEYRWRTDYDFFQASMYGGIAVKFGFAH